MIGNNWDPRRNGRLRRRLSQLISDTGILHKRGLTGNRLSTAKRPGGTLEISRWRKPPG